MINEDVAICIFCGNEVPIKEDTKIVENKIYKINNIEYKTSFCKDCYKKYFDNCNAIMYDDKTEIKAKIRAWINDSQRNIDFYKKYYEIAPLQFYKGLKRGFEQSLEIIEETTKNVV